MSVEEKTESQIAPDVMWRKYYLDLKHKEDANNGCTGRLLATRKGHKYKCCKTIMYQLHSLYRLKPSDTHADQNTKILSAQTLIPHLRICAATSGSLVMCVYGEKIKSCFGSKASAKLM